MATKIPVERTIANAYSFAFMRAPSVLGTIWLPYLVLILISLALIRLIAPGVPDMLASGEFDISLGMQVLRLAALVGFLAFVVGAMITVDLQHKAMGTHTGPSYVFFSISASVWRMAGASFLGVLVVVVVTLVSGLICFAIWSAAGQVGAVGALIRLLAVFATIALITYVTIRLMFFLPAVVVAENSIGLERSWILGGHNFWRILIVVLAVVLPVAVAFYLLSWALFGSAAGSIGTAGQDTWKAMLRAGAMQYGPKGLLMLLLQLIERVLLLGLINGAVASAYIAVSGNAQTSTPSERPR